MSRRLLVSTVLFAVIAGVLIGYYRGLPDDFVDPGTPEGVAQDYGYRCGDGSEFTLIPNADMTEISIVPATSADYISATLLKNVPSGRPTYAGGDITLVVTGTGLELNAAGHEPTSCTSMLPVAESLFS